MEGDGHRQAKGHPHMLPPRSLIWSVTTASPIHTREKTPEKTRSVWELLARMERKTLSNKQKMRGPLPLT